VGTTANLVGGDAATHLTLRNVTLAGACPRCRADMKAIDGTYDFAGGVMTAFRQLGADQLRDVESILRQSRAAKLNRS
jgi:hypothetical protein